MLKRPTREESEDDLLRFQEQFMREKSSPSAKLQRVIPEDGRKRDVVSLEHGEEVSGKPICFD